MTKFLIWCSGANAEILDRCPTDRTKYVGLGGAILTTTVMAFFSFMFAASTVLHMSAAGAAFGGLVWGLAIFNLDRWLVSALKRRPTFLGNFFAFLPRLMLALILGTVIAEPLVLRVFQPEIEQEVATMAQQARAANERALREDPRFAGLPDMQTRIDQLQGVVDGQIDTAAVLADAEVQDLTARLAAKEQELVAAEGNQVCEIEGGCGTGVVGNGPAARERAAIADRIRGERDQLSAQLDSKKADVRGRLASSSEAARATASDELGTLRTEFAALNSSQADERANFMSRSSESAGLLARMKALHRLGSEDGTLAAAQWMLRLFIIAIDAMPVLVKFLMSLFPASIYERQVDRIEGDTDQEQEDEIAIARELARLEGEIPLEEARVRHDVRLQEVRGQEEQRVRAESEVADVLLGMWKQGVLADINANPDAYLVP